MRVTVFGANGQIGRLVVDELMARGHNATAFVHNPANFPKNDSLEVVQGDIYDSGQVSAAVKNSEAVVSALGSWGTKKKDILAVGMGNIIPAMQQARISRIVSLTGSDARASGDKLGLIHRLTYILFNILAGKVLKDGERHIELLQASQLDWTVVRSPRMTKSVAGYSLSNKRPLPWASVGRRAVAKSLVDLLEGKDFARQTPYINGKGL